MTDLEKCDFLEYQLQFRQKVISMCPSDDKKLFYLPEKHQVKSVKELTKNLKTLLRELKSDKTVIRSSAEQTFPIVVSQNKLH